MSSPEHKLYQRQAQCHVRLGKYSEALLELENCKNSLPHSKLSQEKKEAALKDLVALEKEAITLKSGEKKEDDKDEKVAWQEGQLPGGSHKLRLESSNDKVRGRFGLLKFPCS